MQSQFQPQLDNRRGKQLVLSALCTKLLWLIHTNQLCGAVLEVLIQLKQSLKIPKEVGK